MQKRYSKAQWDQFITAWESGGLTQVEFCRQNNLAIQKFGKHRARQLQTRNNSFVKTGFVELTLDESTGEQQQKSLISFTLSESGQIRFELNPGRWFGW